MIRAKKSLGQNFLIDKNIIDKITNIVSIEGNEVLEVGPGTGNLTKEILKKINLALNLTYSERLKIKKYNFELAEKFTYEYYNNRIKNEIFEIKK